MSAAIPWTMLALGLGVVVVRRRSTAILLVTAQSLVVAGAAVALAPERSVEFLIASIALAGKALVVGSLLAWSLSRTREQRPLAEDFAPLVRLVGTVAIAIAVAALVPSFGLVSRPAEQAAVALVGIGIAIVVSRKATLLQALGLLVAENGIALAATAVEGGLPLVIEVGALFDLVVIVTVATAFHERIFGELGTGDTTLLSDLRE
jgi:hydrogenase-4 component E